MKQNIFWRAARRQPLRTLLLLLLTAGVVFAFTARAAEYLLLRQETDRLANYYKAIGNLSRLSNDIDMASFDEVKAFLESDPRVSYTAWEGRISAVLQDMYNADVLGLISYEENKTNYCFTGTLLSIVEMQGDLWDPVTPAENGDWGLCCYFREEEVLAGYPELVWEGRIVKVLVSAEDAPAALQTLTVGKQYLLSGRPRNWDQLTNDIPIEKPTVRTPTTRPVWPWSAVFDDVEGGSRLSALPLARNAPLFYPVPASGKIDWSDPALAGVWEELQICREELSGVAVDTTSDMETMSRAFADSAMYLVQGRWLNHEDDAENNRVCVIHDEMAQVRGLSIGDTITLKLRDLAPSCEEYNGYIYFPESGIIPPYETATETFQIVGTYNTVRPYRMGTTVLRNFMYIPDSAVPKSLHYYQTGLSAGELRFVLTSQEVAEAFLADTRDALARMGLQATMRDTGQEAFRAAVQPILRSSLYNVGIFALVLLTALCLVAFLYLRARHKDVAIARALGVPAAACVRGGALPLVLVGLAGAALGTAAGWRYTLGRGADTLAALGAYSDAAAEPAAEITLPGYWPAMIFGGVFLLVLLLALGGLAYLARRPVLELLQGGSAPARQKEETAAQLAALDALPRADAMTAPTAGTAAAAAAGPAGGGFSAAPVPPAKRAFGAAHTLRFVGCYIRRSKVKSALVLLLAVLFTVGLAAIRLSILRSSARIDEMFNNVAVQVSMVPESSSGYVMGGGFVPQKTVNTIFDTGLFRDAYLEGECAVMRIRREDVYLEDMNGTGQQSALREGDTGEGSPAAGMVSFADLDAFLFADGAADEIEIIYHNGWDAGMFAADWTGSDTLPVLMPQYLYEALQIPEGGRVALNVLWENFGVTNSSLVQVAGVYTGALTLEKGGDGRPYLLAPAGVMEAVMDGHTMYSTARFTLDTAYNRDLDTVRAAMEEITGAPGAGLFPLRTVVWDEELKQAVAPLENSIRLMELLYPVALALSLLAAAGVSALLILTEAREAAIMRVLGTTKLRSRIILSLQVIFMVLAGLMIGLTAAFTWAGSMGLAWATAGLSLLCAAAYLLCATAGSAAGAVTVTNRPPLELLQVRE